MLDTVAAAKAKKYNPTRFVQMLGEYGGVEAAKRLLEPSRNPPEGFVELYRLNLLKISVEYKALEPKWRVLFSDSEIQVAEGRLRSVGCELPGDETP